MSKGDYTSIAIRPETKKRIRAIAARTGWRIAEAADIASRIAEKQDLATLMAERNAEKSAD